MKPIKLTENNLNRVQAAIDAAQGPRCTARTIDASYVYALVRACERRLAGLLPKKHWCGLRFACDPHAQRFPNAHKFTAESTGFLLKREKNAWYLLSVTRGRCNIKSIRPINLSDKASELAQFLTVDF
jgi:hypothetical protein